jgi:hypothetical protein
MEWRSSASSSLAQTWPRIHDRDARAHGRAAASHVFSRLHRGDGDSRDQSSSWQLFRKGTQGVKPNAPHRPRVETGEARRSGSGARGCWVPSRQRSTAYKRHSPGTPLRCSLPRSRKDSPEPSSQDLVRDVHFAASRVTSIRQHLQRLRSSALRKSTLIRAMALSEPLLSSQASSGWAGTIPSTPPNVRVQPRAARGASPARRASAVTRLSSLEAARPSGGGFLLELNDHQNRRLGSQRP